jgi:hypothetical protein
MDKIIFDLTFLFKHSPVAYRHLTHDNNPPNGNPRNLSARLCSLIGIV